MKRRTRILAGSLLALSLGLGVHGGNLLAQDGIGAGAPASTAPEAAPTVTTQPATEISANAATLNGSANPYGVDTWVWFEWGTSSTLASFNSTTAVSISSPETVSTPISGLTPATAYSFRVVAQQNGGTKVRGSILHFTTTELSSAPTVITDDATALGCNSATLKGSVNPNALQTTAWFEWGTDSTLATYTATPVVVVGAGTLPVSVQAALSTGLHDNTTYYFRAVASSSGGTARGVIVQFRTYPAPDQPRRTQPHTPR